jgi:hypothetical protein
VGSEFSHRSSHLIVERRSWHTPGHDLLVGDVETPGNLVHDRHLRHSPSEVWDIHQRWEKRKKARAKKKGDEEPSQAAA